MVFYMNVSIALRVICVQITFSERYLENSTFGLLALVLLYLLLIWLFSSKGKAGMACVYGFSFLYNNTSCFGHLMIDTWQFSIFVSECWKCSSYEMKVPFATLDLNLGSYSGKKTTLKHSVSFLWFVFLF